MKGALGLVVLVPLAVLGAKVASALWPFVPMAVVLFGALVLWRKQ